MKSLIERLVYRSQKASYEQATVDESDLDSAIAAIQALSLYHAAYSDARFAPVGSWEAADAARRMEDAYDAVEALAKPTPSPEEGSRALNDGSAG